MPSKVAGRSRAAKKDDRRMRNPNFRMRNPKPVENPKTRGKMIAPEVHAIRDLLRFGTPDHLHNLTGIPLSSCQKMVSGDRALTLPALRSLGQQLDADQVSKILIAFFGADAPISKRLHLAVEVRHARRVLAQLKDQDL